MLVDVARQLFARMGVDNTTMNDIAQASRKGRRTLYTYFKSKNEIYLAVVESELDQLHKMLVDVASKDLPADEKLLTFIYSRLDAVKALVFRNGTLRATFFRDIWRVEKVRKSFDLREVEIIKGILDDGVKEGIFSMPDTDITALVLHHALKGLEVPYIRGIMGDNISQRIKRILDKDYMVFTGNSEAEVVAEGAQKSSYEETLTPVVGKRFKVQTTTRVSSELQWADEDAKLEITSKILADQAAAMGRVLDYVIYHAFDPKKKTTLEGFNALAKSAVGVTATDDRVADIDSLAEAVSDEYDINGIAPPISRK